jgi:hypothetical protein
MASTVFRPAPLQHPIPVWVAGRWPARRPFRRAARWQGVFVTHADIGHTDMMAPQELASIVDYVRRHRRPGLGPLDVVMEGVTPAGDRDAGARIVSPFAEVGLTWWVEKLGWFRGDVDEMRDRVRAGPPASLHL